LWLSQAIAASMMEALRVGPATFLADLGSGDGALLLAAAARGAHCIG
jgi:hypothetical protein